VAPPAKPSRAPWIALGVAVIAIATVSGLVGHFVSRSVGGEEKAAAAAPEPEPAEPEAKAKAKKKPKVVEAKEEAAPKEQAPAPGSVAKSAGVDIEEPRVVGELDTKEIVASSRRHCPRWTSAAAPETRR